MIPLAPVRFSMTICWPSASPSFCATSRAVTSATPPAGNGTMQRIGRTGYGSAAAAWRTQSTPATATRSLKIACRIVPSNASRRDDGAHLRLVLDAPQQAQQIVDAVGRQMLLRHEAKLLFHFGVGHRILEVSAVVLDPDCLALARCQHDLELAQVEFALVPVGFIRRQAFDAAHEVEQPW